jgi:ArsR family transcriptional regulator, arsenate/arsenite/antimonite-responsive transcriptional repressor
MKQLNVVCCAPGAPPLAAKARESLAARFKALADPTRVAIVNRLAGENEVCVCVFVEELGLSQPTISHHLRILREAGLVEATRRGTWAFYRLVPEAVAELAQALAGDAKPRRRAA